MARTVFLGHYQENLTRVFYQYLTADFILLNQVAELAGVIRIDVLRGQYVSGVKTCGERPKTLTYLKTVCSKPEEPVI